MRDCKAQCLGDRTDVSVMEVSTVYSKQHVTSDDPIVFGSNMEPTLGPDDVSA